MQLSESLQSVQSKVKEKYVFVDDVVETIYTALKTNKGALLYGRGGHAKSEVTTFVMETLGIQPFILSCGEGLTVDNLFGGLDMAEFKKSGLIHYNVEHSFMNHEVVIFEELLDTPASVLLELKDVLTRGSFEKGSQRFQSKVKCVLALTNRTREEYGEDNSIRALLERFPLGRLVEWKTYHSGDYLEMYKKVFPTVFTMKAQDFAVLSELIERSNDRGYFISPRTARHAADVMIGMGMDFLHHVDGIDTTMLDEIKKQAQELELIRKDQEKIKIISDEIAKIKNEGYTDEATNIKAIKFLKTTITTLQGLKVHDKAFENYRSVLKTAEAKITKLREIANL